MAKVNCLIIENGKWIPAKLHKIGEKLVDKNRAETYVITTPPVYIGKKQYYLLSPKGTTLHYEVDDNVLKLKTNAGLIHQIIESEALLRVLRLKPTRIQIIAGVILGLIVGAILGGLIF